MRPDQRAPDQIRKLTFQREFAGHGQAEAAACGSVLVHWGQTSVLCSAMIEEGVPGWRRGSGLGWLTAEYAMLPASTPTRKARDISRGKLDGRSSEIQRLIGRSMRAAVDLSLLGERTLWLDCDVVRADGGTRTAAINGAMLALKDAVAQLIAKGSLVQSPIVAELAAVSVGVVDGEALLDLEASEDQRAEVDMNVVMTRGGEFVEVQGSAEKGTFGAAMLAQLILLAENGSRQVVAAQEVQP